MLTNRCFLLVIIIQTIHAAIVDNIPDIIGGEYTTIDKFPYAIAIFNSSDYFLCGGSVLKHDVVITAAHCISIQILDDGKVFRVKPIPGFQRYVVAGHENYTSTETIKRNVTKVLPHPCYTYKITTASMNDIGLMFLSKELPFGIIKPVKISKQWPEGVKKADAYGWGMTSTDRGQSTHIKKPVLKYINLKVYTSRKCCIIYRQRSKMFGLRINKHPGIICVGNRHARKMNNTVFKGDSGSGLVLPGGTQIGLVSCLSDILPGVVFFTNVTFYYDWIMDNTK